MAATNQVKVAIVTGSNKGIGLCIVRGLCKQFQGDVFLTSRDAVRGQEAVQILVKEGLSPKFHQLDVSNQDSVLNLKDFLLANYGGLDVLVNNAGMAYSAKDNTTPFAEQAVNTLPVNYNALVNICDVMFPILRPRARVVHLASRSGTAFLQRCSDDVKSRFVRTSGVDEVTAIMEKFVEDAKAGRTKDEGWPQMAYGASKMGVIAITPIQQAAMDTRGSAILINSCCPGDVQTDMSDQTGNLTPDEGALTPLYLALLPENEQTIKGCFVRDKKVYDWENGVYP